MKIGVLGVLGTVSIGATLTRRLGAHGHAEPWRTAAAGTDAAAVRREPVTAGLSMARPRAQSAACADVPHSAICALAVRDPPTPDRTSCLPRSCRLTGSPCGPWAPRYSPQLGAAVGVG
ncbi:MULTISPECIES: hypothetical protein [Streptomyces]|uniref:Uncharacterized protein n=1 Tax=Streptomyces ortus TaxID=2867268 RepID=A0ABT3VJT4_9ACTN|nr:MULTISPECIES: hypothetical protein [Streptomyces]MCX4238935.1 hypothetical protein [Streptomyces ortus]